MIDALIFVASIILFLDYMHKSYVTKDPEDPETKKWIAEIEADKRREKFFDNKKDGEIK
tara:strand:- start:126 stop:302 length:177 start_codon:yes stop_codon:yes gene_type:complete